MSLISKAVKSVSAPVKKVVSIAANTASGFAAGGSVGAVAGLTRGVYENTKTSKAETINLRTVGQAAVTGGVANVVAGGVAALPHILAGGSATAASSFFPGGVAAKSPGIFSALSDFGKSGGLVGNAANIFGTMTKAGAGVFSALGNFAKGSGVVPGGDETAAETNANFKKMASSVKTGYQKAIGQPAVKDALSTVSNKLIKNTGTSGSFGKLKDMIAPLTNPQNAPSNAPVVLQAGGGFDASTLILPAALIAGAYFLFGRGKKVFA